MVVATMAFLSLCLSPNVSMPCRRTLLSLLHTDCSSTNFRPGVVFFFDLRRLTHWLTECRTHCRLHKLHFSRNIDNEGAGEQEDNTHSLTLTSRAEWRERMQKSEVQGTCSRRLETHTKPLSCQYTLAVSAGQSATRANRVKADAQYI